MRKGSQGWNLLLNVLSESYKLEHVWKHKFNLTITFGRCAIYYLHTFQLHRSLTHNHKSTSIFIYMFFAGHCRKIGGEPYQTLTVLLSIRHCCNVYLLLWALPPSATVIIKLCVHSKAILEDMLFIPCIFPLSCVHRLPHPNAVPTTTDTRMLTFKCQHCSSPMQAIYFSTLMLHRGNVSSHFDTFYLLPSNSKYSISILMFNLVWKCIMGQRETSIWDRENALSWTESGRQRDGWNLNVLAVYSLFTTLDSSWYITPMWHPGENKSIITINK